jgi:hypothetical protein
MLELLSRECIEMRPLSFCAVLLCASAGGTDAGSATDARACARPWTTGGAVAGFAARIDAQPARPHANGRVTWRVTITNLTPRRRRLEFSHPPTVDVDVCAARRLRYRFTDGRAYPAVTVPVDFAPHQARTFTLRETRLALRPGTYDAYGYGIVPGSPVGHLRLRVLAS